MFSKMKKILAALLMLALLACGAPVLADEAATAAYCSHYWLVGETMAPPSCTSSGVALRVCAWCGALSDSFAILPKTAHDYSVIASASIPASCTSGGWAIYACSVCGESEGVSRWVAPYGHSYETYSDMPSCTKEGVFGTLCSRCGTSMGEVVRIPATGHSAAALPAIEAGCKTDGRTAGESCSTCGEILSGAKTIPAKGHVLNVLMPKEATCTESGLTIGEACSVCGEVIQPQTIIPAKGHELTVLMPKDPGCTEPGLSIGEICAVCKEVFQPQAEIPAAGHKAVTLPGKAASCSESGLTEGSKCSVCGLVLTAQKSIPATEHAWKLSKNGKKYVCEGCGEEISAKPSAITIEEKFSIEMNVGDTLSLNVIYSPRDSYSPLSWSSSSKKVVSVDADGCIEALKEGSATITVKTANGKKDTLKVKVVDPCKPSKVELDQSGTIILGVGEELQLDAVLYPATAVSELEWDSNSSRCKVDQDGLVTAVRTGSATITVETENGKKDSVKIQVVKADVPYSVTLSESDTIYLAPGEEFQLDAVVFPATADYELKWSSSSSRCTVDEDGLITAVRSGSATITVKTDNGKKDTVKVKVY